MTPFEMGASSGMEKTAATRALKELRKMTSAFDHGASRYMRGRGFDQRTGAVARRMRRELADPARSESSKRKMKKLYDANYSVDAEGYRPGTGWLHGTHDALMDAHVRVTPGELQRSVNEGDRAVWRVKAREQQMRRALKNPDFSYSRDRSAAADKVRARAKSMGLNK